MRCNWKFTDTRRFVLQSLSVRPQGKLQICHSGIWELTAQKFADMFGFWLKRNNDINRGKN